MKNLAISREVVGRPSCKTTKGAGMGMSSHCDMMHLLQAHGGGKGRGVVDARQNAEVFTWGGVSFITASYENDRCARSIGGE